MTLDADWDRGVGSFLSGLTKHELKDEDFPKTATRASAGRDQQHLFSCQAQKECSWCMLMELHYIQFLIAGAVMIFSR